jgi:GNAT superfamily N-acetyltransferase
MHPLQIQSVVTETDRHAFLHFPWRVYQGDPYWVPPFYSERVHFITAHPFLAHAEIEYFMAKRGEEVVGTIAAFINHRHNEFHNEHIGFFGFFEVLEDPEAAAALLKTAEDWVRARGYDAIRGPAQFSTNEECGLLVDGFDDPPRILMTYNPKRYVAYIESQGYTKAMDLHAYALDTDLYAGGSKFPEKLIRVVEKIKAKGDIHIRKVDMKHFDQEVIRVKEIYNQSWARNWGFVPMTDTEFDAMGDELRQVLDPDMALVCEIDGKPIGVSITLPDLNQPLRCAYPRPGTPDWWTMVKLAWHWKVKREVTWARVLILGVLPEYRARGVDALFYYETAQAALKKGIQHAEMSWILENNDAISRPIRVMGGEVYKTYRFYDKRFDDNDG